MSDTTTSTETGSASGAPTSTDVASASGSAPTETVLTLSCKTFTADLVGTADEIWTGILSRKFGTTKKPLSGWRVILARLKTLPVAR